jgi:hypothetical protein
VKAPGRVPLLVAAGCSAAAALLHVAILLVGPPWYRWFGAPSLADRIENGSVLGPTLLTLAVAAVLVVWAGYGLSGAGVVRRFPLLRVGLYTIAVIYLLRGLQVAVEVPAAVQGKVPARFAVFSAYSALAGLLYLVGALRRGRSGRSPSTHAP